MSESREAPMSGVLRVVYFLAVAAVAVLVVVMALTAFYDPPVSGFDSSSGFGVDFGLAADDDADYNRNVSLILALVSAGAFTVALVLDRRFNPLRSGVLLGGLILYLTAMGYAGGGSDQWIAFVTSALNLAVLVAGFWFLIGESPFGSGPATIHPAFAEPPEQAPSGPENTSPDAHNDDDPS